MALDATPRVGRKRVSTISRAALVLGLLGAIFAADRVLPANVILSFLYGFALMAAVGFRQRRWLWAVAAASVVLTLVSPVFGAPVTPGAPVWVMWTNRGLTVLALLAICAVLDREQASRTRFEKTDRALRESERRFRTIFESAAIGIARVAFEGERWLEVNDTFCRMLGRTREEMLVTPWPAMTHPDDLDLDLVPFRRMAAGELDSYGVEKRFIHKDGHPVWARLTLSLVRDAEGRPDYEIAVMEDISARKAQEEKLRASEARQRELLATLDLGASMARDPFDDSIRFWSAGCEHLYGWTESEAMGRPAHELLQTVFPIPRAEITAALERDGEWTGDLRQCRRDGVEIIVAAHKLLRRDQDGRPLEVLESLADVTAQREAERVLARDNVELERLVEARSGELVEARARAAHAERMQALGQLASGVAHDFNNVLQAVQGGVGLIEKRAGGNEAIRRLAAMIAEAAGRGSAITRRLLAFSRRGELRAEPVDPVALLDGLREILAQTLGAAIEVRVEAPEGVPPLLADKVQLETVLINLATNARDAMPEGGVLTFAAGLESVEGYGAQRAQLSPGPYVRLSVTDTGAGMTPEVLARVTEPFFTTKGEGRGTGLGLAMAKGFAEQSGGDLDIESAPGRGTTVTLWFPRAPVAALPRAPPPTAASDAGERRGGRRILLVDDEDIVRELTAEQLREQGFTVLPVASGPAALALLDAGEAVDLVISDLGMPGMDGVALIREVQLRRKGLPAVLLTGALDAAEPGPGGDAFIRIRKPVSAEQLAERAALAIEGSKDEGRAPE